ncbi:MAG TPA: A24 family peptidase [Enteractinococcus sp.]
MTLSSFLIALLFGLTAAAVAAACTQFIRDYVPVSSRLLRFKVHIAIAGLFGLMTPIIAHHPAEFVGFLLVGVGCSLLIVVDVAVHRLPDRLVTATFAGLLLPLCFAAAAEQHWVALGRALLISLVLVAGYFILALITPAGLGLGDVKFAAVMGLFLGWFGWSEMLIGTVLGFILNGLAALALLIRHRQPRTQEVAFGPSMVLGAILALIIGQ